jgi:hypothetical protein
MARNGARQYRVIRERAGDGTLYEVADLAGKVVSRHPMNNAAEVREMQWRNIDAQT